MTSFTPTTWTRFAGCAVLAGWLAACSANQLFNEGVTDINAGRWDVGLAKIEDAVRQDPDNAFLRTELRMKREYVIHSLLRDAESARTAVQFADARRLYQRALDIDNDNQQALDGLEQTKRAELRQVEIRSARELMNQRDWKSAQAKLASIQKDDPANQEVKQLLAFVTAQLPPPATAKPKLRLKDDHVALLEFRDAPLSMVFEAISRTSGINFVLDKDIKGDAKTSIFVKDLLVESAVDMVLAQHALEKKILADNIILVYPDTLEKRRRYEEQIVKSFYLTNADPKQAMSLLKVMLDTKVLFVDDHAKLLVMRDTPEVVRMAEKLIVSLDLEDSEVMMEVEVVEIQRAKLQELGVKYPTQITLNALDPTTGIGAGTSSTLTLSDVFKLNPHYIGVSPLSMTIDLRREDTEANLLASPRIRARNYEKAKILIGDRVPVITNAVTPTNLGSSVVTGNVQYIDVGLKFEVEPVVYRDDEVAMKVNLEVSNIVREVQNPQSGTLAYQIGTRTAATVLRLRDGETQVLAGLISDDDREVAAKVPGLANIPILGRLFTSQKSDLRKTEIVLSITPHVIRHGARHTEATSEILYGTESTRGMPMMIKTIDEARRALLSTPAPAQPAVTAPKATPAVGSEATAGTAAPATSAVKAVEQPESPPGAGEEPAPVVDPDGNRSSP